MARLLLGVSGGIAAYKALELGAPGHQGRPRGPRDPDRGVDPLRRHRVVRRHHRRAGARHRVGAGPAARRLPGRPAARARAALAPRAGRARRRVPDRAASANTIAKLAARPRRQPADRGRARLPATADRRSGHERRDVRAPRHAGQPRAPARARGDGARARHRLARLARRVRDRPPARAARAAGRRSRRRASAGRELDGLEVLVTAGGTREPIDAVRFVGNRSSGRMGFALAEEAARRGADVTVVAANVSLPRRSGIEYVDVETAAELADACEERFDAADVLLMAAAVADYRPPSRTPASSRRTRGRRGTRAAARAYNGRARDARRPPPPGSAAGRLRRRARRGRARVRAREARAQGPRRGRRQRRQHPGSASTPPRTRSRS